MTHNKIDTETQADIKIFGKIDDFFKQFKMATSLHQCGIRRRHGHSVRTLILAIFTLPFVGDNFFRGIATNVNLAFGKDAAYDVLKGCQSKGGQTAKLVFVQDRRKTDWLTLISADLDLSNEDIVRIYGKRWDDEVSDISFVESLYRIMTFAGNQLKKLGSYCEKTATAFLMQP